MPLSTPARSDRHPQLSRRRLGLVLGAVVAVLAAVNLADKYGPAHTGLVVGPLVAVALLLLARRAGLTWADLGLSRHTLGTGAKEGEQGFSRPAAPNAIVALVCARGGN